MKYNLKRELKRHLTGPQWAVLKTLCETNGIPMDDSALEYGSPFLTVKYWFMLGWNERKRYAEREGKK